jgi:hypothetical protein
VGASDARAEKPAHRPITPADLGATILAAIGIGVTEQTQLGIAPQGQVVRELV